MSRSDARIDTPVRPSGAEASRFFWSDPSAYAPDVKWLAPARGLELTGREAVLGHLRREASGLKEPEFTSLRRSSGERYVIDEFAVRFLYGGEGLEGAPIHPGDFVELHRVRILELAQGLITTETCIENWTVLPPPGDRPHERIVLADTCPKGHGS